MILNELICTINNLPIEQKKIILAEIQKTIPENSSNPQQKTYPISPLIGQSK